MALQINGAISLNQIHIEAGGTTGTRCSLNDADIRGLIGKASGAQMSFNEWYGASAEQFWSRAASSFNLPAANGNTSGALLFGGVNYGVGLFPYLEVYTPKSGYGGPSNSGSVVYNGISTDNSITNLQVSSIGRANWNATNGTHKGYKYQAVLGIFNQTSQWNQMAADLNWVELTINGTKYRFNKRAQWYSQNNNGGRYRIFDVSQVEV